MMDVNSGYIGHSMSRRAAEAYEDGEMPKGKWMKKAMVAAIRSYCDEFDMLLHARRIERADGADTGALAARSESATNRRLRWRIT